MTVELTDLDDLPSALAHQAYTLVAVPGPAGPQRFRALLTSAGSSPAGLGLNPRGAWAPNTAYAPGDLVTYQGSSYAATLAFTSTASFDLTDWQLIAAAGAPGEDGAGGIVPDGETITTNSEGKAVVAGVTPDTLSAADPTKVGAGTLVVTIGGVDQKTTGAALVAGQGVTPDILAAADPAALGSGTVVVTVGGVDKKTTGAALAAVGTIDLTQATSPSNIPSDFEVIGLSGGQFVPILWSTLKASVGSSSGNTTPAANTYAISTSSTGIIGTAQPINVSATGTLSNSTVVTLHDDASGTFAGTVTLSAGTNPSGSTQYTPASAGTRTITGTNNGGLTNPAGVNVTVSAASSGGGSTSTYPALVFDNGANTFDTTTPLEGAASFKNPGGKGAVTLTLNGPFCIELLVRAAAGSTNTDNTGDWLHLVDSAGNPMGISTTNGCLRAQANGNGGFYDTGYPLTGGAGHLVTLDYDGSQLNMTLDGGYHTSAVGATWVGGATQVTLYGGIGPSAGGVDAVRISGVSKYPRGCPTFDASTYTGARDANTIVCYNFNQQDGRGS